MQFYVCVLRETLLKKEGERTEVMPYGGGGEYSNLLSGPSLYEQVVAKREERERQQAREARQQRRRERRERKQKREAKRVQP